MGPPAAAVLDAARAEGRAADAAAAPLLAAMAASAALGTDAAKGSGGGGVLLRLVQFIHREVYAPSPFPHSSFTSAPVCLPSLPYPQP